LAPSDRTRQRPWPVENQLNYWCELLSSRKDSIQFLRSRGYELQIDCYLDEGPIVYIELPPALLETLGEFGIGLKFGIYDWNNPELQKK
jgi:hypothetical protein